MFKIKYIHLKRLLNFLSKHFFVPSVLIFISISANCQTNYKSSIYNAYVTNNMAQWRTIIDELNLQKAKTNEFILELINYQYGYIAWCIGNNQTNDAEKYLELANKNIKFLENQSFKPSYTNSYKAALIGFEIGLAWYKAPFIGSKSISCSQTAIELDKNNPFGYLQYANTQYYMPETFGGSKTVALQYYKKALKIMERQAVYKTNNWNYLSLLTTIAQAHSEIENYETAKEYYEKIMEIEPNFVWVKNELFPELLKKYKNVE